MTDESGRGPRAPNYRKPPLEHQFKKGQSGNPGGRPKKRRAAEGVGSPWRGGAFDRVDAMALEEALRPISIREGDQVTMLPAMQAVLRSMYRAAANGDTKAQRHLLDLVGRVESERSAAAKDMFVDAVRYKEEMGQLIAENERQGLERPALYPDPDDVIVDLSTGEVTIKGPVTKEQAAALAVTLDRIMPRVERYFEVDKALEADPRNSALRKEHAELEKYRELLRDERARNARREAGRMVREALNPVSLKRGKRPGRRKETP
jgi:Family of unknown function (DUF5681)